MELVVARIGRPHGIRGEVSVETRTDVPEVRFAPGARLGTDPAAHGPLTVTGARDHSGRWLLTFEEVRDRTAAEALRGVLLTADVTTDDEPDAWHPHELVGLQARTADGLVLGEVVALRTGAAQDLLELREPSGHLALVPFVTAIVPVVDVQAGHVVLDPPGGLLHDLATPENEPAAADEL